MPVPCLFGGFAAQAELLEEHFLATARQWGKLGAGPSEDGWGGGDAVGMLVAHLRTCFLTSASASVSEGGAGSGKAEGEEGAQGRGSTGKEGGEKKGDRGRAPSGSRDAMDVDTSEGGTETGDRPPLSPSPAGGAPSASQGISKGEALRILGLLVSQLSRPSPVVRTVAALMLDTLMPQPPPALGALGAVPGGVKGLSPKQQQGKPEEGPGESAAVGVPGTWVERAVALLGEKEVVEAVAVPLARALRFATEPQQVRRCIGCRLYFDGLGCEV